MSKGIKNRLIILILLIVFIALYVITHAKRKLIIKDNIFYGVEEGIFESKLSMKELIVPAGVKSISAYSLVGCENLEAVELPDTLESIGELSFMGCRKLGYIKIPGNVRGIGIGAFLECSNLKNIELPEGLEKINAAVFKNCTSLEKISIPLGVKEIDESAFSTCRELTLNDFCLVAPLRNNHDLAQTNRDVFQITLYLCLAVSTQCVVYHAFTAQR